MAQQPDAPPESIQFNQFTGLKNTVSAERLTAADLERAVNVDLDDAGQVHRRRGYTKRNASPHHSLFTSTRGVFGVRSGMLGLIQPDYSFVSLGVDGGTEPISYTQVGEDVYFSSLDVSGIIHADNSFSPWGQSTGDNTWLSPVINPTSTLGEVRGKLLGKPPMATSILAFNGRIYMAQGKTLWATELYLYNLVDKTKNFIQFTSEITALGLVDDGIFVGTEQGVDFLSGPFGQMKRLPVADAGVLPGSMVQVPAEQVHPQARNGEPYPVGTATMFMTKKGLCAGFNGGQCFNLTQNAMIFPDATKAAALYRDQDGVRQYVSVAESGGTPASNARIGDYVDAEIRRFQGV